MRWGHTTVATMIVVNCAIAGADEPLKTTVPQKLQLSTTASIYRTDIVRRRTIDELGNNENPLDTKYKPAAGRLFYRLRQMPGVRVHVSDRLKGDRRSVSYAAHVTDVPDADRAKIADVARRKIVGYVDRHRREISQWDQKKIHRLAREYLEATVEGLTANGAQIDVGYAAGLDAEYTLIVADADGAAHGLNKFAAAVSERFHGVQTLLAPAYMLRILAGGLFYTPKTTKPLLMLPLETSTDRRMRPHDYTIHELRHAYVWSKIITKKPSPYFGEAKKGTTILPQSLSPAYQDYLRLDEVETNGLSLRIALRRVMALMKQDAASPALEPALKEFSSFIKQSMNVAIRTNAITKQTLAVLAHADAETVHYELREHNTVFASVRVKRGAQDGAGFYTVTIPLIDSPRIDDAQNLARLTAQLHWAQRATQHQLALYRLANKVEQRLDDPALTAQERIVMLDALRQVLRPSHNDINHRADAPGITMAQATADFYERLLGNKPDK